MNEELPEEFNDPVEDFAWLWANAKDWGVKVSEEKLKRSIGWGKEDFALAVKRLRRLLVEEEGMPFGD